MANPNGLDHYGYIVSHAASQQPFTGLLRRFGSRPKPALYPVVAAQKLPQVFGPHRPGRAISQYTTAYATRSLGLASPAITG